MEKLFKKNWSMGDFGKEGAEVNEVYKDAVENPEMYVLKPQKEGGGNNLYGDDVKTKLLDLSDPNLSSYIIQPRVYPPLIKSYHVTKGKVREVQGYTELGMASCIFTELKNGENQVVDEWMIGMFCHNKDGSLPEADISRGTAALDYPILVPIATLAETAKGLPMRRIHGST
jgi:glutathione synthase